MKRKHLRTAICLMLMLALVFALALTANAQKASAAYDPADPQVNTAPTLTIAYKNLSYSSDIYVMYAVSYENVASPGQITMLFWNAPQDEYLKGTEAYSADARRAEDIGGVSHEIF